MSAGPAGCAGPAGSDQPAADTGGAVARRQLGLTGVMEVPPADREVLVGHLATNASQSKWDVRTENDRLLQVKARVLLDGGRPTEMFSPFRDEDGVPGGFDAAVFVIFDARTYEVSEAYEIEGAELSGWSYSKHINGYRLTVSDVRRLAAGGNAQDTTTKLQEAYEML